MCFVQSTEDNKTSGREKLNLKSLFLILYIFYAVVGFWSEIVVQFIRVVGTETHCL